MVLAVAEVEPHRARPSGRLRISAHGDSFVEMEGGIRAGPVAHPALLSQVRWERWRKGEMRQRRLRRRLDPERPSYRARFRLACHMRSAVRRSARTPAISQAFAMRSIGTVTRRRMA